MADIIEFKKENKHTPNFKDDMIEALEFLIEDVKEDKVKGIALAIVRSQDSEDLSMSSAWLGLEKTKSSMYSAVRMLNYRFEHEYFESLLRLDLEDE